jgi:hypothetical protein
VAVAPAGAAAPALAYLVVGLLALLAWAIQRGLLAVWVHTFGALLQKLADLLTFRKLGISVDLGGPIRALDTTVRNALVNGAKKAEHLAGYFFHGCAVIARWMARETEQLAADTLAWATWLQHAHLPKWVKAMVYATFPPALIARLVQAAIHANLPHIGRTVVKTVEKVTTITVNRVTHAAAGAVALPGFAARLPSRVGELEHELLTTNARLRKIGWVGVFASAAGLVAVALKRLGLNCLLGRNGKKLGKELCHVDPDFFASLFLDGLLLVGSISVVEFAKECAATVDFFESKVTHFIRELEDAVADYLGPIKGAPKDVEALLNLSFTDYLD